MCTALRLEASSTFMGRNLDIEHRYNETVTIMPRNFPLKFRNLPEERRHFSAIGMAFVASGYPLFYDGINEHGLFAAALRFPESCVYKPKTKDFNNIASFELIPFVLSKFKDIHEVKSFLEHASITDENFRENLPAEPLHWFFGDKKSCIIAEQTADGIQIYGDPTGVLTNEPPFFRQLEHRMHFMSTNPCDVLSKNLPGDYSSCSRFLKASVLKEKSFCGKDDEKALSQFFHILSAVAPVEGAVKKPCGTFTKTVYTSCANAEKGIYYYRTYSNSRINALSLFAENLDSDLLISYPLNEKEDILFRN